jgi:ribonuclease HII
MLICGIDEAGRGCVLGSLIVAAVVFDKNILNNIPVKDSKKISKKKRENLSNIIKLKAKEINIIEITAGEINKYHNDGLTLNQIEVIAFSQAINGLSCVPEHIYMDAADVSEKRFQENIEKLVHNKTIAITAKHKADETEPIVSAASIIAKVRRDSIIEEFCPVSGYGDKKTIEWLKQYYEINKKLPEQTRTFWKTIDKIYIKNLDNV